MYSTDCYHHQPAATASQHYNLGPRRHTLQLPEHHTRLLDSNFFVRMLYKTVTSTETTLRFLSIEYYCSYCAESARYFQLHSFFIIYYTLFISMLCTTLHMSVFNKELLTYLLTLQLHCVFTTLQWGNALSYKLEVGEGVPLSPIAL